MSKFLNILKLKHYLKIKNYKIIKFRSGFTLIELLVTVAISSVVMVTGFVYLGGYRTEQNLKNSANELLAAVKNTQTLSKSQQDGKKWGVHFVNTTSSAGQSYTVFSGTSFAGGTVSRTYPLRRNVSFSNPWASSTLDLIFNTITGYAPYNQVISLITGRGDGFVNDIVMNTLGQITSKFDTGLVGYWHLDENTSSTAYDASGNSKNGILTNSPTWQTGSSCKAGGCLSLGGVNSYVVASSIPNLTGAFTVEAWATTPVVQDSTYDAIVSKFSSGPYNGWFIRRNSNSSVVNITIYNNGSSTAYIAGPTIIANAWTYYAVTFDGTSVKFYVNGVLIGSAGSVIVGSATTNFAIGGNYGGSTENWNGYIDEVRIYNRALTATEIQDQYNALR